MGSGGEDWSEADGIICLVVVSGLNEPLGGIRSGSPCDDVTVVIGMDGWVSRLGRVHTLQITASVYRRHDGVSTRISLIISH